MTKMLACMPDLIAAHIALNACFFGLTSSVVKPGALVVAPGEQEISDKR